MPKRRGRRGAGAVTQRPNGKWQAQWSTTEGGKRVRKTHTFILKGDAEWWLREAKRGQVPDVNLTAPEFRPEPIVAMTPREAVALVEAVKGHWMEQLVRFLLGSGVRIGEALALDQRDVEEGFVRVRRPKTVPRAVPVSGDAALALAEAIRLAPRSGPREPVFYGPLSGDRLTREVASHALPRLLERAGLRRLSPHALRHGVATLMLTAGVPMPVIAEQLGHRSERMTRRYAHVVPQLQRRTVGVLDEAVKR